MAKTPEELEKEIEALRQHNAELQKNVDNYKANAGGDEALKKRLEDLEATNQILSNERKRDRVAFAKIEAVKKYPFAAPYLEKIPLDNPEDVEAKAKDFHEAATKDRDAAIQEKEKELAARWGQLPTGSPPGFLRKEDIDKEYEEAKTKNSVKDMLKAKIMGHLMDTAGRK